MDHVGIEGFLTDTKAWLTDANRTKAGGRCTSPNATDAFGDASFSVQQVVAAYENGKINSLPHMKKRDLD